MKVLLWQDVEKLGKRGEVVDVRDGYARNYLIPRRMAREFAEERKESLLKEFELAKRRAAKQEAALLTDARSVAEKLTGIPSVSIEVNTNAEGHLYGAVTPTMVADALRDQGLKVEPRQIEIAEPIKQVGTYELTINLHKDIKPKLKVWVLSTKAVKPEGEKAEEKKPEPPPPA